MAAAEHTGRSASARRGRGRRRARTRRRRARSHHDPRRGRAGAPREPSRRGRARATGVCAAFSRLGRGARRGVARPRAGADRLGACASRAQGAARGRPRRHGDRRRNRVARRSGRARRRTDPATIRAAGAYSLLETTASQGWHLGVELERALRTRVRVIGTSLVHTLPRLTGMLRGYPYEEESVDRLVRSPARHLFGLLPGPVRRRALRAVPAARGISAAFAGPPSVAHAEALLRGTEERARSLGEPLDAICLGIPGTTPYLPRERPNPLLAAYLGLGLALRTVARRVSRRRRRHGDPRPPVRAALRASEPAAVPQLLPRDPRGHGARARPDARRRARCGDGCEGDRGVPRGARASSAAAVRRLERVRAGARTARSGARRRLPRSRRGARSGSCRHGVGAAVQMAQSRAATAAHRLPARAAVLPAAGACAE